MPSSKRKDSLLQNLAAEAPPAKSPKHTGTGRPKRSTQGQGGAILQLQKVAEKITASATAAQRGPVGVPPETVQNPMAPQCRPKPRKLPKVPGAGSNQSAAAAPGHLVMGISPVVQTSAALPRRADATEGSPYGFRAGPQVGAGKAAPTTQVTPLQAQAQPGTNGARKLAKTSSAPPLPAPHVTQASAVPIPGWHAGAVGVPAYGYRPAATELASLPAQEHRPTVIPVIDPAIYAIDNELLSGAQHGQGYLPPPYTASVAPGQRAASGEPEDAGAGEDDGNAADTEDAEDAEDGDEDAGADASEADDGGEAHNSQGFPAEDAADRFQIDEQSPDEDERQARVLLQQPRSPEARDEGREVLSEHRQRNRAVRPPTLNRLHGIGLQQHASGEHHDSLPDGEDQDEPGTPGTPGTPARALRRSAKNEASFLRFYAQFPGWFSVLENAKTKFRLYISTTLPFPTTELHSSFASTCVTEAMTDYHRDSAGMPALDESVYHKYRNGMNTMLFNDAASYRNRLKTKARLLVEHHYEALYPDHSTLGGGQAEYLYTIKTNVADLLDGSFLLGDKDDEGRTSNFAHPALKALCQDFYYGNSGDNLAKHFPAEFATSLPPGCLLLAATAIANCLQEYLPTGSRSNVTFSGEAYTHVYADIKAIFAEVAADPYHANKLQKLLQAWACEAMLRTGTAASTPIARQFKSFLD